MDSHLWITRDAGREMRPQNYVLGPPGVGNPGGEDVPPGREEETEARRHSQKEGAINGVRTADGQSGKDRALTAPFITSVEITSVVTLTPT